MRTAGKGADAVRKAALKKDAIERFIKKIGGTLRTPNGYEHWIVTKGKDRIEWWPSTGRLVVNQHWKFAQYFNTPEQFTRFLIRYFEVKELWRCLASRPDTVQNDT